MDACRCVYKTGNTPMMSMHGKVIADINHSNFSFSPIIINIIVILKQSNDAGTSHKVADFQIWDSALTDDQLLKVVKITSF